LSLVHHKTHNVMTTKVATRAVWSLPLYCSVLIVFTTRSSRLLLVGRNVATNLPFLPRGDQVRLQKFFVLFSLLIAFRPLRFRRIAQKSNLVGTSTITITITITITNSSY